MTDQPHPISDSVSKLVAMLGSDQDGEALAAARALGRVLAGAGLGFMDLAEALKKAPLKKVSQKAKATDEAPLDPNAPLWSDSSRLDRLILLRQLILERWLTPLRAVASSNWLPLERSTSTRRIRPSAPTWICKTTVPSSPRCRAAGG